MSSFFSELKRRNVCGLRGRRLAAGRQPKLDPNRVVLVSGFLKGKATVDNVAEELREKIGSDALEGPAAKETIAQARAQLGETDAALKSVRELLETPGESSLTPALLRMDPLWDPIRNDPRFQRLLVGGSK